MGVPGLAPWVQKNFPTHWRLIRALLGETSQEYVDNLYIDGNALLHPAAQTGFHYGNKSSAVDRNAGKSYSERLLVTFETFFSSIKKLVRLVKPKKAIYIALDGSAPLAKQAQQRLRRFNLLPSKSSNKPKEGFDPSSITPGTPFMLELTRYMRATIRKEINDPRSLWHKLDVVFSPATVPGEGEHKLMDYIRNFPVDDRYELSHCVCGPDGDLLMLTLATKLPRMFLLREDQVSPDLYIMFDIGAIYGTMPINLISPATRNILHPDDLRNLEDQCVDDFVLLGFFVGNDFLPRIEMFQRLARGLDRMMDIYRNTVILPLTRKSTSSTGRPTTKINVRRFSSFVEMLQGIEVAELTGASKEGKVVKEGIDLTNYTLLKNVSGGVLNLSSFRVDYYAKSKIFLPGDSSSIGSMSKSYARTLCWILEYYTGGLPSWDWYYPWHYAPLMMDFASSLKVMDSKDICSFEVGTPSEPFLQLLTVTPKSSAKFLPGPLKKLYDEEPLSQFLHVDKKSLQDFEGKPQPHMAIIKLPFVDVPQLKKKYLKIKKRLKYKYVRNEPGQDTVYRYDSGYTASFESPYWTTEEMHVVHEVL